MITFTVIETPETSRAMIAAVVSFLEATPDFRAKGLEGALGQMTGTIERAIMRGWIGPNPPDYHHGAKSESRRFIDCCGELRHNPSANVTLAIATLREMQRT